MTRIHRFEPKDVTEKGAIRLSVFAMDNYMSTGNHFCRPSGLSIHLRGSGEIGGLIARASSLKFSCKAGALQSASVPHLKIRIASALAL